MAERLIAELQLSLDSFAQSLTTATALVQSFAASITQPLEQTSQAFQQQVQAINNVAEATRQADAVFVGSARARAAVTEASERDMRLQIEATRHFEQQMLKEEADDFEALQAFRATVAKEHAAFRKRIAQEEADATKQALQQEKQMEQEFAAYLKQLDAEELAAKKRLKAEEIAQERLLATEKKAAAFEANQDGKRFDQELTAEHKRLNQQRLADERQLAQEQKTLAQQTAADMKSIWAQAFAVAGSLGIATSIGAIIGELKQFAVESVQVAAKLQALSISFAAIFGSAKEGDRTLKELRAQANTLGVDFLSLATNFRNFEAAAKGTNASLADIRLLFQGAQEAARTFGLPLEQQQRLFQALDRMMQTNVVNARELRIQFGQALPGGLEIFAKAIGVTVEQMFEMTKKSELLFTDVLPKLGRALHEEFGQKAKDAAESANATFTRFGNNMLDVSRGVGDAILTILQPIINTINKAFDLINKAKEEAAKVRNEGISLSVTALPLIEGKDLQAQLDQSRTALAKQQKELQRMNESAAATFELPWLRPTTDALNAQKQVVKDLETSYNALLQKRDLFLKQQGADSETGIAPDQMPYAKNLKALDVIAKESGEAISALDMKHKYFHSTLSGLSNQLDEAREKAAEYRKEIEKTAEEIAKSPGLSQELPDTFNARVGVLNAKSASAQADVERIEKAIEAQKEAERETERAAKEAERFAKNAADTELEEMRKRQKEAVNLAEETLKDQLHVITMRAEAEANQAENKRFVEQQISEIEAKATKTRLDDFYADLAKRRHAIEQRGTDAEELQRFDVAGAKRAQSIITEENDKELKKQAQAWQRLGTSIQSTLASSFEKVLSGSKSLFEGIRDLFIKLLANLAAEAATRQIVLPLIARFFGSSSSTGGTAGTALSLAAGTVTGTEAGADSGDGGSLWSQALGTASSVNTLSGAAGGPSVGLSSLGMGSGGLLSGLAGTELGELGISGPGYLGGEAGSLGGLSGTTLGGLATAAGVGIAAGSIFAKINALLGLHGTGNTVLAGAGGGAIAGTMIVPGIGTAIGAAVGALGGYISTLFGSKKEPGFQFQSVQPGQVGYDALYGGLGITQPFAVLKDYHEKLGSDYEDFIGTINTSLNDMFGQVVSGFKSSSPQIQQALVGPLTSAMETVAEQIQGTAKVSGDSFKDDLQKLLGETIPGFFNDAVTGVVGQLKSAVAKLDPVIQGFNKAIETLKSDLLDLEKQRSGLHDTLQAQMTSILRAQFSPAQNFLAQRDDFTALMSQFNAGDPSTRLKLAPQLSQLAGQLFTLAKDPNVLGQDAGLVRQIQSDLVATLQQVQTQSDSIFVGLEAGVAQQITLAQEQVDLLASSLTNLGSVDANILIARGQLEQLNASLTAGGVTDALGRANSLYLAQITDTGMQQLTALQSIDAKISNGVAGPGFQHGAGYVPQNMWAYLHQGERVVTAAQNRSGTGSGNAISITIHGGNNSPDEIASKVLARIEQRAGRLQASRILVKR